MESRINNPIKVSSKDVEKILSIGWSPTIQFSEPKYNEKILKSVNKLCKTYGDQLEVRFYGHYSSIFDCSVLKHLPDVEWLSVDCLTEIENIEKLSALTKVTKLSFGVYRLNEPNLLSHLNLPQLKSLSLGDNDKKNLNLKYLSQCESLESLNLTGHLKNIEVLSTLNNLNQLTLRSISKKQDITFLNSINSLKEITFILGGRENINEFTHQGLTSLEIVRVRGFDSVGDLTRFPNLLKLRLEDQIKLDEISLPENIKLEVIGIHNCKKIKHVHGLFNLKALREFRTSRTDLPLNDYLEAEWPKSINLIDLYSSSVKWNNSAKLRLKERGYTTSPY